jgi:hypothetical protein
MHQLGDMGSVNVKTTSWGLCPWFLFCAQKEGKKVKNAKVSTFEGPFSLFRKFSHTKSTENINYFFNQKLNFMFPNILKNNIPWIFKIVITTWITKFKNFITNLYTRGSIYEWHVCKVISLKLTFKLFLMRIGFAICCKTQN